jgi:hypothetical protein
MPLAHLLRHSNCSGVKRVLKCGTDSDVGGNDSKAFDCVWPMRGFDQEGGMQYAVCLHGQQLQQTSVCFLRTEGRVVNKGEVARASQPSKLASG